MYIVFLRVKVAPEKKHGVIKAFHSVLGPTSAQPGCLFCEVCNNTQDDDELILLQKWDMRENMEKHIHTQEFQRILAVIENACEPPEITFNEIATSYGIELLEMILEK